MPLICARDADICLSALMVFSSTDRMARSAFAINVKINTFFAIYSADTPTNVLPSMHVVGCMAVLAVTFDSKYLKKVRIPAVIIAVAICAATVFVKQHSILDVAAAIPLCAIGYYFAYVRTPKKSRSAVPDVTR